MTTLIIILIMLAVVLSIALAVSLRGTGSDDDRPFRNPEGDHVYYDKSIIEKKRFHSIHPKEAVRTISRLLRSRRSSDPKD